MSKDNGKKDVGLKVSTFPRNTFGTHKSFGSYRAQNFQEKNEGSSGEKLRLGTQSAQTLQDNALEQT